MADHSYWQSSMGYKCFVCRETFLIGWRHKESLLNYCECCKGKSVYPSKDFIELIY